MMYVRKNIWCIQIVYNNAVKGFFKEKIQTFYNLNILYFLSIAYINRILTKSKQNALTIRYDIALTRTRYRLKIYPPTQLTINT